MTVDRSWNGVYKSGGLALFAGGAILAIFLLSVFIFRVDLPLTPPAVLENPKPPVTLYLMAAIGEVLLLPAALALYLSLKDVNKNFMLLAAAAWSIAAAIYLVSRGQILSLLPLAGRHAVETSESMKAAYLASAAQVIEVANIYGNMALMLHQAGSIIMGLVMLKGVYGRRTGYLVTIVASVTFIGTFGVVFQPLSFFTLFGLMLTAVWQIVVGVKLYKLGQIAPGEQTPSV